MYSQIVNYRSVVGIIPVVSTSIYASGDHVGTNLPIAPNVGAGGALGGLTSKAPGYAVTIEQITVWDADAQNAALDLFFYNGAPTITSTDNNAYDLTDAEQSAKCVGVVSIASSDYQSWTGSSGNQAVATLINVGFSFNVTPGNLWYVSVVSRGTPTYVATDSLRFYVHYRLD